MIAGQDEFERERKKLSDKEDQDFRDGLTND